MNVPGAEGLRGESGDQGRIDATTQSDQGLGETALDDIIAEAEHERSMELLLVPNRHGFNRRAGVDVNDQEILTKRCSLPDHGSGAVDGLDTESIVRAGNQAADRGIKPTALRTERHR